MNHHHSINYLEIPSRDIVSSKTFFNKVFGWCYVDYGPEYSCFMDAGITGGFYQADVDFTLLRGSPLIVLYSNDLESTQAAVIAAGGKITTGIFIFPGGGDSISPNPVAMNMLSGQNDPLSNPCVRNCCLNEQDVCLGCFRHLDEILAWRSMSEEERCGCYVKMVERRGIQQAKWTSQK